MNSPIPCDMPSRFVIAVCCSTLLAGMIVTVAPLFECQLRRGYHSANECDSVASALASGYTTRAEALAALGGAVALFLRINRKP